MFKWNRFLFHVFLFEQFPRALRARSGFRLAAQRRQNASSSTWNGEEINKSWSLGACWLTSPEAGSERPSAAIRPGASCFGSLDGHEEMHNKIKVSSRH